MSQAASQILKSFQASATIPSFVVVKGDTANKVKTWDTTTAMIIGVSQDYADTDDAVPVVIAGTAKVRCAASVPAYALVKPSTVTANVTPGSIADTGALFTVTAAYKTLGIALEAGSTNSVIEVLLQISNVSGT